MRRAQTDKSSQLIKNFAYNPSFEAAGISTILRTNVVTNPSLEATGTTTAIRTNLASNPSFEATSGTVDVRTNLATNPSFEATSGTTTVRTNLNTYPSFEVAGSQVNVRTNLCINPRGVNAFSDYQGPTNQTITPNVAITGHPDGITTANRVEYSTGANPGVALLATVANATAYTLSAWVYHETVAATPGSQGLAHAGVTSQPSPPAIVQGVWQKLTWSLTTTSTSHFGFRVSAQVGSGSYLITGITIEQSAGVVGPFFDGATAAQTNLVKTAPTPLSGITITNNVSYAGSSTWSRATVSIGSSTFNVRQNVALADLGPGGKTYTAAVTVANDQAFTQQVSIDWCDVGITTVTLQPGEQRRLVTSISRPTYDSTFRFSDLGITQSSTETRSVLFKDWLVEEGTTTGEYFATTGDFTYGWAGTANASVSYQKATGLTGWMVASTATPFQSVAVPMSGTKSGGVLTRGFNGDGAYSLDVDVTAGKSYTSSIWVKLTTSVPSFSGVLRWKDTAQNILLDDGSNVVSSLVVGSWVRVSVTATAPANATKLQPMWRIYASHTPTIFYLDGSLILESGADTAYFDGATAASGDFTYAWQGTAHASKSYQQAPSIATWQNRWFGSTGGEGSLYQAKGGLSGTYARKLWTQANTGSSLDVGLNTPTTAVTANMAYTLSGWVRCSITQYFNFYIEWRDAADAVITATQKTTGTSVTANTWTRLSVTGTAPANATSARFMIGPYGQAVAMPAGATTDYDNILIEALPVLKDYFDGANPIQNLCTNPSFATNTVSYTTVSATLTRNTTKGGDGHVGELNQTVNNSTRQAAVYIFDAPQVPGTYAVSWDGATTVAEIATARSFLYDSVTGTTVSTAPTIAAVKTGSFTRYSFSLTATSQFDRVYLEFLGTNIPLNSKAWIDRVLIERGTTASNPYYEGTGDFTYVWSGTANASTSIQRGVGVTGYSANSPAISSTAWTGTGTKSIRIIANGGATGTSKDSFISFAPTLVSGKMYTLSATLRMDTIQTLSPDTRARKIVVYHDSINDTSAQAPNVVGTSRLSVTFTVTDATVYTSMRLYNGSGAGDADVWWDDIVLEEGATNGSYFDGSNPIRNLADNPNLESNADGWSSNDAVQYPMVRSTSSPIRGVASFLSTRSATTPSTIVASMWAVGKPGGITVFKVQPGEVLSFSMDVKASQSNRRANCYIAFRDNMGVSLGTSLAVSTNLINGTAVRVGTAGVTMPANCDSILCVVSVNTTDGSNAVTGEQVWFDSLLIERSATINSYYEGTGDFTFAWAGTANASMSVQNGTSVVGRTSVFANASIYQSSLRSVVGTKSGAILAKNLLLNNATLMYPQTDYVTGTGAGQITPGVKNTWSMWVWVPSGSGTVRLRDITTGAFGSPSTLFDQWERISVTFSAYNTGNQHALRLRSEGNIPAGTTIWWDGEMIEASSGVGNYFDGSTAATTDFTYNWAGTANASNSEQKYTSISNLAIFRDSSGAAIDSKFYGYKAIAEDGKPIARWVAPAGTANSTWRLAGVTAPGWDWSSVKAGGRYTLMFRWRSSGWPTGTLPVKISYANGLNDICANEATILQGALNQTGWQTYRRTFTALRDGDNQHMIYISLPTTPQATVDGVFDMRDWMVVEGEYTGDYVDGTKPFSKWNGTPNASTSIGYPPQLLDIAGKPTIDLFTTSSQISSPDVAVDGFAPRTFYLVYEVTDINAGSWQVPFNYGPTPSTDGFTFQTNAAGVSNMVPRADFATGGGSVNATTTVSSGRTPGRVHVTAFAFNQGLTGMTLNQNGGSDIPRTFTPGSVGWTRSMARLYTAIPGIKGVRVLVYEGVEHNLSTRQAISRYLGNKYGASVA